MKHAPALCLWLCLLPGLLRADPRDARSALNARAAALAAQEAQTAGALRGLEERTAQDSAELANLQVAQAESAQHLVQAEAALAKLLPIMQRLANAPAATLLTAPVPPRDAVRGLALVQGVASAIAAQARIVQTENAQLAQLIAAAQASRTKLTAAAGLQQRAEQALTRQIASAKQTEMAAADPQAAVMAKHLAAQNKLDNLNDAVTNLVPATVTPANLPASAGNAPVAGSIVQRYGAPTLAGPAAGISYGAAPGARVTTPCAGTVMFAGPFPSYGLMVIADCGAGASVVLAGMNELDVAQGEHLVRGQPVGAMQGLDSANPAHQPRLYVEVRQNGAPVDPTMWLGGRHSG